MTPLTQLKKKVRARMTLWQKIKSFFDLRFRYETWKEVREIKNWRV
jgi:hypothetical protein